MDVWGTKGQLVAHARRQWEDFCRRRPHAAHAVRIAPVAALVIAVAAFAVLIATDDPRATLGTPQAAVLASLGHPTAVPADAQEFVELGRKRDYRFRRLLGECSPFTIAAGKYKQTAEALADVEGSVLWYDRFPARSLVYVFNDEQRLTCVIKGSIF